MFYINLMSEGRQEAFKKKNTEPIFGRVKNEGDKMRKKNIGQLSGKVNEGSIIKKKF